jgi:hypothetical protein
LVGTADIDLVGTVSAMSYSNDPTDEQWALLEPVFNTPGKRGPIHGPDLRRVVDAMLSVCFALNGSRTAQQSAATGSSTMVRLPVACRTRGSAEERYRAGQNSRARGTRSPVCRRSASGEHVGPLVWRQWLDVLAEHVG